MALQTLRRQKQAIETILAENRRLRDEILEETRFGGQDGQSNRGAGEGGGANLRQLVAALEVRDLNHEAFIAQEQRAVEALIAREEELGEEIRKVRQSMGGIFNAKEQWVSRHRRIVLLENQVSQAMTGCDTLDTTVKQLVREIDGLRKEKALFDQLQGKLKRSLRLNAQHIGELLLLAFNAHKSKRRAQKLLEKVQLQTDKETAAYMEEWRQLDAVLKEDADQKERRFQTSCVQRSKRLDAVLARKRSRRKEADQSTATEATESPPGVRGTNPKQRLLGIEASLAQVVKGLPGCHDVDSAIEKFQSLRETCFELFESLTNVLRVIRSQNVFQENQNAFQENKRATTSDKSTDNCEDITEKVAAQLSVLSTRVAEACKKYASRSMPQEILGKILSSQDDLIDTSNASNASNASNLLEWIGKLELICSYEFNCDCGCEDSNAALTRKKDMSPAMPPALWSTDPRRRTSMSISSSRTRSSGSFFSFARFPKPGKKWKSFRTQRRQTQGDDCSVADESVLGPLRLSTLHARAKQAVAVRLRPANAVRFGDEVAK